MRYQYPANIRRIIYLAGKKNRPGLLRRAIKAVFYKPPPVSGRRLAEDTINHLSHSDLSRPHVRYRIYAQVDEIARDVMRQKGARKIYPNVDTAYDEGLKKFANTYVDEKNREAFFKMMDKDHVRGGEGLPPKHLTNVSDIMDMVRIRYPRIRFTPEGVQSLLKKGKTRIGNRRIDLGRKLFKLREDAALLTHMQEKGEPVNWKEIYSRNFKEIFNAAPPDIQQKLLNHGLEPDLELMAIKKPNGINSRFPLKKAPNGGK